MWPITHYFGRPNQKPRNESYKSTTMMALNHVTPPIMESKPQFWFKNSEIPKRLIKFENRFKTG